MSNIIPFQFEGHAIRIIDRNGEPWFVLSDVCRALNHSNPSQAVKLLDSDERDTLDASSGIEMVAGPNVQQLTIVSEAGLYRLLSRSTLPAAKRFDRWVRHEVLPSIRKTGSYGTPAAIDYSDPIHVIGVIKSFQTQLAAKDLLIKAAAPKVEFCERHANGEGCYNLQTASQLIGLTPNKLSKLLVENRYLHRQNGSLRPYAPYTQEPHVYFYLKATVQTDVNGVDHPRPQVMITPKGLQFFAGKFGKAPLQGDGLFAGIA